jgi:hypothetical protein
VCRAKNTLPLKLAASVGKRRNEQVIIAGMVVACCFGASDFHPSFGRAPASECPADSARDMVNQLWGMAASGRLLDREGWEFASRHYFSQPTSWPKDGSIEVVSDFWSAAYDPTLRPEWVSSQAGGNLAASYRLVGLQCVAHIKRQFPVDAQHFDETVDCVHVEDANGSRCCADDSQQLVVRVHNPDQHA